jgi:type IV pilus assembly protein PilV
MVALSILLVGLLGLLKLHVLGTTANAGGRMQTQATEIARELAAGLERLPFTDTRLSGGTTSPTAPAPFGWLVQADGSIASGARVWSDADAVPGVRPSSVLPLGYQRRWTVWDYARSGAETAVRIVAVSVTWTEPAFGRPREVVLYTQVPNPAALMTSLANNQ